MNLVRSKSRVAAHGEVFTPPWLVNAMLDLVKGETERIDSRFLDPAAGNGNFLVEILRRKLAAVELQFSRAPAAQQDHALLGLMSVYGIELLADNAAECRARMLATFADYLGLVPSDTFHRAASYVVSQNVVQGDSLTQLTPAGRPITFPEWTYLGNGRFRRRDFLFAPSTSPPAPPLSDTVLTVTDLAAAAGRPLSPPPARSRTPLGPRLDVPGTVWH